MAKSLADWERESEIMTIEEELLPELQDRLAYLTAPDYDPAKNPDDELREFDIESAEDGIAKLHKRLAKLKLKNKN